MSGSVRSPVVADYPHRWESDVVLTDGGTVHVRPVRPDDADALLGLYQRLSQESLYLRYFSPVPAPTARQIDALAEIDYTHKFALVAELGDDLVAIARFDGLAGGEEAEVAFTVQDDQQGRGLGTILLEHLAGVARELGVRTFVASTLASNARMRRVFADAGFQVKRRFEAGVLELSFPIEVTPRRRGGAVVRASTSPRRTRSPGCWPPRPSRSSAPVATPAPSATLSCETCWQATSLGPCTRSTRRRLPSRVSAHTRA